MPLSEKVSLSDKIVHRHGLIRAENNPEASRLIPERATGRVGQGRVVVAG
jgi:hypothetical protein